MKLAFVTDSGTGFSAEFWKERGIYSLPLQITIDQETYEENETIPYRQIIQNLHDQVLMKTSLPSLGKIEDLFEQLKNEGYEGVFCVPICSGLSGTLNAMESAAHQVGLKFYGYDCYSTAVMEAHCIDIAKRLYEQGKSIDEIMATLDQICAHANTVVLCDDLQHMKRGGRLTAAAAMLGGMLKIKPLLHLDRTTAGRVDVFEKVRTMTKAQDRIIDHLQEVGVQAGDDITVAHVDSVEAAKEFAKKIATRFPECTVRVIDLVSAVGIHTGLNALCVQAFTTAGFAVDVYNDQNSIKIQ